MNLFGFKPLFRALKQNNLTFAAVFATIVMGASAGYLLRSTLSGFGLALPFAWIASIFIIGFVAKQENRLKLDQEFKRRAALSLILGSIFLSISLGLYQRFLERNLPDLPEEKLFHQRDRGPRGKH